MRLMRDVLDNQLVDRNKVKIGKADSIIVEIQASAPPKIVCIETGLAPKVRRIHPALARLLQRWTTSFRIPWSKVRDVGIDIDLDLDADSTPLLRVEKRLAGFISKIPFS